ncbi:AfsR/SARP family transcriptional regulator [Actinophytocola oryzae]|uniref:DNA-binding SARP family transcriptional activator n=1 Tax=Actinophytocola oryzae TaxID=502181 RepID=A0A4V3FRD4_9PSEU|nr:BTAD domain-containing putative transcriptional regulator [Actinophytocola oryzae]TDV43161.1 DNA-binding SARP family transcriptional activator [Actinophytocola oryzae]
MTSATDPDERNEPVRFELLGPVAVVCGDRRVQLRAHRHRVILSTLLLEANRVVSGDTLVDSIWEAQPPVTARSQIHICVSAIRRRLREFGADHLISTEPNGYLIRVEDDQLDHRRFARLTATATQLARQGNTADAATTLRQALALWRGRALADVNSGPLSPRAARLDEDHLVALESCAELELRLGRHRELISELAERVASFPLRERSRAQLMLALHRSGRQAEALEVYREGRRELVEQLGLEPGEELRRTEALVLSDEAGLPAPEQEPAPPPPARQLPADIGDFVGHDALVERLTGLLVRAPGESRRPAVPVVVVTGTGGVGKSTLAVHVAHLLAGEQFPDGQLYANLGGNQPRPRQPGEVLSRFLRALGVFHSAIPDDVDERAELYRSLLAERQVLVLLDGAVAESQVRSLLPGSATCGVLVTSRTPLTGLAGAAQVDVRTFDDDQAAALLGRIAGVRRVEAERAEVTELSRLVGGLPLGLRIIGSRLAARPHWTLGTMSRRLADRRNRLDELAHGDLGVRSTISFSYESVPGRARLLLRLLSEVDTDGVPDWLPSAVLDTDRADADEQVETLVDAQLVELVSDGARVRYRIHELVRVFAREQSATDSPEARTAMLTRVCGGWLLLAEQAHQRLYGGQFTILHGSAQRWGAGELTVRGDPLHWLETERVNLCAAVRLAGAAGLDELAWDLAMTLVTLFEAHGHVDEWVETHEAALEAVRRTGNRRGEAAILCSLGSLYVGRGQTGHARSILIPALRTFMALGDPCGRALAARNIAAAHFADGDLRQSSVRYQQALAEFRRLGDQVGEAHVLISLARIDLAGGDADTALAQLEEALRLAELTGHDRTQAQALHRMGEAALARGRPKEARQRLRQALVLVCARNDRIGQMHVLHALGRTHLALRQHKSAERRLRDALTIAGEVADPVTGEQLRSALGHFGDRLDDAASA